MAKIWVYGELDSHGNVEKTSLEILTKVRELGATVEAVALGPNANAAAGPLGEHGATTVFAGEDSVYTDFVAQPAAEALFALVQEHQPDLLLFPFTYDSRDIASRLAVKTGSTIMGSVTNIVDEGTLQTAIFGGSQIVDVKLDGSKPRIGLVRPKAFDAAPSGGTATVTPVNVTIGDDLKKSKRVDRVEEEQTGPKLEEAPVIVSGGRGLQDPANFKLLEDLAAAIGNAAVGATRAVVDAGWVPYSMQIGQTGKTVKPKVYIAVGISGATQHIVGMKSSDRIIAINKDAEAPIFQLSDLGVVGDALKIVPQLTSEVQSRKG